MKTFQMLSEDCTWRDVYDALNQTNQNLSDVDFLYKSYLGDGQIFNVNNSLGRVNNIDANRNKNIVISKNNIASFTITGFQFYDRATNSTYETDITCDLLDYADNKVHFLYLVKGTQGTYEVHDTMYNNSDTLTLFARFVISATGDSCQFYVIAPFAGSPDYIKGNQFYEVVDGLNLRILSENTKQFNLTSGKVRFSGINFDDLSSPDLLKIEDDGANRKFRYVYWDAVDEMVRVNFTEDNLTNSPIANKIMNYETGAISSIDEGKTTCQKIYYDIYSGNLVAMYGNRAYDTLEEALLSIDHVLSFPKPDNMDYLIPVAALVITNGQEDYSDDNIRIIGLSYNETEIFDSNELSRQQSFEAIEKAEEAIDIANSMLEQLNTHKGNKSNPHGVTKSQVGLGNIENYGIASEPEAQLATLNTKYMTPLRTMDTIKANSVESDGNIILKIGTVQPTPISGKTIVWINTNS